jgi:hypothetical protein
LVIDRETNAVHDPLPAATLRALQRERVSVRRRRSKRGRSARQWSARTSRRRLFRTLAVSTGVLLLMALGLYFGLAHNDVSPSVGSSRAPTKPVLAQLI